MIKLQCVTGGESEAQLRMSPHGHWRIYLTFTVSYMIPIFFYTWMIMKKLGGSCGAKRCPDEVLVPASSPGRIPPPHAIQSTSKHQGGAIVCCSSQRAELIKVGVKFYIARSGFILVHYIMGIRSIVQVV